LRSLSVDNGLVHGLLGAGELGGGDDLHGLGDLLDVANGLEAALDLTESGIVGGLCDEGGGHGRGAMDWMSVGCNGDSIEWRARRARGVAAQGVLVEHTARRRRQP
jgi:hypothetical protein